MKNVFLSEWVKLRRPSILFGTSGAMAAFAVLANFGLFRAATNQPPPGRGPGGGRLLLGVLEGPGGPVRGLIATTSLIGVVALGVFAANVGNEYRLGTLRFLLVGEPRRLRLLAGKLLALASLAAAAVATALTVGVVSAIVFAGLFDVSTAAWFGSDGLQTLVSSYANVTLACVGWGLIGAVLALVMRTATAAIIIGVAYLLVGEAILSQAVVGSVLDVESAWFPGEVLRAFAAGGGASSSYLRAALLVALYAGAMTAAGLMLFNRRDVVN